MSQQTWTETRIDDLKALNKQGLSASAIAARLGNGISRNAVIGKLHRMGIRVSADRPGGARLAAGRKRKRTLEPKLTTQVRSRLRPDLDMLAALRAMPDPEPGSTVSLQDLEAHQCRFPYGEKAPFRFCGCAVSEGLPYCDKHAAKCFTAEKPKPRTVIAEHRQKVSA